MRIAFYKGKTRLFNKLVAAWTVGPYSHVEALFDALPPTDGKTLCGSSSFMDGGVRLKWIALDPAHWDIMDVPEFDARTMLKWFEDHRGAKYDLIGLLSTSCPIRQQRGKYFCNEAIGAAAGLQEPWRFNPNSFARICMLLPGSRWIQDGDLPVSLANGEAAA